MDVLERNGWRALLALVAFVLAVDLAGPFRDATSRAELPARTLTLWSVDAESASLARLAAAALREDAAAPVRVSVRRLPAGPDPVGRFAAEHAGDPTNVLVAGSEVVARADRALAGRAAAVLTDDRFAIAAPGDDGASTLDALYARLRAGTPTTVALPDRGGTLERLVLAGAVRAARARPSALRIVRAARPSAVLASGRVDAAVDRLSRLRPAVVRGRAALLAVTRGEPLVAGGRALPMFASQPSGREDPALALRRWVVVLSPPGVAQDDRRAVGAVVERATESSTAWWEGLRTRRLAPAEVPAQEAAEALARERASIARLSRTCVASCSRQRG